MTQKNDRRKYPRHNEYLLAKYKPVREARQRATIAAVKDISGGGACLQTEEALSVSSAIQLSINFPSPDIEQPIFCNAKIVWVRQSGERDAYENGVEFTDIKEDYRNLIMGGSENIYTKGSAI